MDASTMSIILMAINIAVSASAPLMIAFGSCIRRVRHSECCGGRIDIDKEPVSAGASGSTPDQKV